MGTKYRSQGRFDQLRPTQGRQIPTCGAQTRIGLELQNPLGSQSVVPKVDRGGLAISASCQLGRELMLHD